MDDIKRILVVSTPPKSFRKIIHYGISLSKKYEAKLYILHSFYDPFHMKDWDSILAYKSYMRVDYKKRQQKAKEDIDKILNLEKKQGLEIEEFMSKSNHSDEIFEIVRDENIDLIVMLSHERRRLEHHIFDLDKEQLILNMPCSILLVKA